MIHSSPGFIILSASVKPGTKSPTPPVKGVPRAKLLSKVSPVVSLPS
jgi:hypothetical protein